MNFIHFIDQSKLDSIKKNGLKVGDCYRGKGILVYPDKEIQFKTFSSDADLVEDEKQGNKLSNNKKWEKIGTLGLIQNNKTIRSVKVKLTKSHWPIKVFIDIQHNIAIEFAELLNKHKEIKTPYERDFAEIINEMKYEKYVFEGTFIVENEIDLTILIECFLESGGGIWGAHSFDCMLEFDIPPDLILI